MTVAVASHQRRAALVRLLESLAVEVRADLDLAADVEVVVVLDGSTDGSREAVEELDLGMPRRVVWKPNGGLASARNAGWQDARGDLVLFLDDDLVAAGGLLRRHLTAHVGDRDPIINVGPCELPADLPVPPVMHEFWLERYAELAAAGRIERFDHFSAANTSAPVALVRTLGGFDERFVGYGLEDYDFGRRALAAGVDIVFDRAAVAWHHAERSPAELCRNRFEEAQNLVRFVAAHPDDGERLVPDGEGSRPLRWLHRLGVASPPVLRCWSAVATRLATLEGAASRGRRHRLLQHAAAVAYVAGLAAADAEGVLLDRVLGRPGHDRRVSLDA